MKEDRNNSTTLGTFVSIAVLIGLMALMYLIFT